MERPLVCKACGVRPRVRHGARTRMATKCAQCQVETRCPHQTLHLAYHARSRRCPSARDGLLETRPVFSTQTAEANATTFVFWAIRELVSISGTLQVVSICVRDCIGRVSRRGLVHIVSSWKLSAADFSHRIRQACHLNFLNLPEFLFVARSLAGTALSSWFRTRRC